MFSTAIKSQLESAIRDQFEVEVLLEGRTIYPSLIAQKMDDDSTSFRDAEGATITLLNEKLTGCVVHTSQPRWLTTDSHRHLDVSDEQRTGKREKVNA